MFSLIFLIQKMITKVFKFRKKILKFLKSRMKVSLKKSKGIILIRISILFALQEITILF